MAKRRAILERIAGAAGVGAAVAVAGCGSASDGANGTTGDEAGTGTGGGGSGDAGNDSTGAGGGGGASGGRSPTASGPTVKGTVKGKEIVPAGADEPLVRMNETTITASDSAYDGRFERGNFTVGDGLAEEMSSEHGELAYYLVLRLTTEDPSIEAEKGDRVAYRTSRRWFNAGGLGELVWARTAGGEEPYITELIGQ
ncbi:hypothetical protein ACFO0N_08325 [Halobium salinum]|uniref:Uncharacterized protein n=1 Tax=Halobium salinum TaxID=1364940 RepID=A0ABD5PAL2_9EURY|nr:hypothetical protein [Halobium salinum]